MNEAKVRLKDAELTELYNTTMPLWSRGSLQRVHSTLPLNLWDNHNSITSDISREGRINTIAIKQQDTYAVADEITQLLVCASDMPKCWQPEHYSPSTDCCSCCGICRSARCAQTKGGTVIHVPAQSVTASTGVVW